MAGPFAPLAVSALTLLFLSSRLPSVPSSSNPTVFSSHWSGTRRWLGPHWWAHPLWAWRLHRGRAIVSAAPGRHLSLLTHSISLPPHLRSASFRLSVSLQLQPHTAASPKRRWRRRWGRPWRRNWRRNRRNRWTRRRRWIRRHSWRRRVSTRQATRTLPPALRAGVALGARGPLSDHLSAAVVPRTSLRIVLDHLGHLRIGKHRSATRVRWRARAVRLSIHGRRTKDGRVRLEAVAKSGSKSVSLVAVVPADAVTGAVALVADGPGRWHAAAGRYSFAFEDLRIVSSRAGGGGQVLKSRPKRAFGPVLWTQYSLSERTLRLQAQLAPLDRPKKVTLWTLHGAGGKSVGKWHRRSVVKSEKLSRTATFKIPHWNATSDVKYRVTAWWGGIQHSWFGTVRRNPVHQRHFSLAAFSCDYGYLFPLTDTVRQVQKQDPDMVFFAGDQLYEDAGGSPAAPVDKLNVAVLEYLSKYYRFGWSWRFVLRNRPSVIIPDDHDVLQGNLFGNGGVAFPKQPRQKGKGPQRIWWGRGGYILPGKFVKMVERTQVGHLPESPDKRTLPIGIKPFYTSIVYGNVGIAVLEDRKFKSAPLLMPKKKRRFGQGGQLLGVQQEGFLSKWAEDWDGHSMKVALSATIFANAATHESDQLKRNYYVADSGAWPRAARNRAVRLMGKANAFAIHGDQHLGMFMRHGVSKFDDAGYAFMVPGVANGYLRSWWPGVKGSKPPRAGMDFRGRFRDDAGLPINVLAVANPEGGSGRFNPKNYPNLNEAAWRRGSGYGMVVFDKKLKTAKVNLFRVGGAGKFPQFKGFPVTVKVGGGGQRKRMTGEKSTGKKSTRDESTGEESTGEEWAGEK